MGCCCTAIGLIIFAVLAYSHKTLNSLVYTKMFKGIDSCGSCLLSIVLYFICIVAFVWLSGLGSFTMHTAGSFKQFISDMSSGEPQTITGHMADWFDTIAQFIEQLLNTKF
jgi:hypothetical protein